ncbi:hypothetical protein SDC9_153654 [bioreactor metagenome]|uniref:Uncharacterized protein n=1 Tax=bioreactor metagenome TaxID=1076179 RepID=A0A645EWI1_9ZZZZ
MENISNSGVALMVEAAWHYRPVREHAYLVSKAEAVLRAGLRRVHVRPIELILALEKQIF